MLSSTMRWECLMTIQYRSTFTSFKLKMVGCFEKFDCLQYATTSCLLVWVALVSGIKSLCCQIYLGVWCILCMGFNIYHMIMILSALFQRFLEIFYLSCCFLVGKKKRFTFIHLKWMLESYFAPTLSFYCYIQLCIWSWCSFLFWSTVRHSHPI